MITFHVQLHPHSEYAAQIHLPRISTVKKQMTFQNDQVIYRQALISLRSSFCG